MKRSEVYNVSKAYYSSQDHLFHVLCELYFSQGKEEDVTFEDFGAFYQFVFGRSGKAPIGVKSFVIDLVDYDCKDAPLEQINRPDIRVSSDVQARFGLYKPYDKSDMCLAEKWAKEHVQKELNALPVPTPMDPSCYLMEIADSDITILYISDLHLDEKLAKKYPGRIGRNEIDSYLESVVDLLATSINGIEYAVPIFLGDVSSNLDILRKFFDRLWNRIQKYSYLVLGNHELWNPAIEQAIASFGDENNGRYHLRLRYASIIQNSLVFLRPTAKEYYSEQEILDMNDDELYELIRQNGTAILGGIGFAGKNNGYNASKGIYGSASITVDDEVEQSKRFEVLHEKVRRCCPDNRTIIVATHMPITDWTDKKMQKGWYYLSGHTHNNSRKEQDDYHFIADNQVGYFGEKFFFKFLAVGVAVDVFEDYADGKYEISVDEYKRFLHKMCIPSSFNRDFETIIMLKKSGNYMFFGISPDGLLYYLNGGSIRSTQGHDVDYFYERMDKYSKAIRSSVKGYFEYQKSIAKEVIGIGGRGIVHGCIIDLDPPGTPWSYNHLYVNPLDGSITPYYATSMINKYVYANLRSILHDKLPALEKKYEDLKCDSSALLPTIHNDEMIRETKPVLNTEIYRISRLIRSFQRLDQTNVIRSWSFEMSDSFTMEDGKLLIREAIGSDERRSDSRTTYRVHPDRLPTERPKKEPQKNRLKVGEDDEHHMTEAEIRRYLLNEQKKACKEATGGTVTVIGLHYAMVELKCRVCGHSWVMHLGEKNYSCPNCRRGKGK